MNKQQLIAEVSFRSGISKEKTRVILNAMMKFTEEALSKGESIQIENVATLSVLKKAPIKRINHRTGMIIMIPEKRDIIMKANCPGPHII